jgi:hypothetical protein
MVPGSGTMTATTRFGGASDLRGLLVSQDRQGPRPGTLDNGADAQEVHLGGHPVGVYVLLKYAIDAQNFVGSVALVRSTVSVLLPE